MEQNTGAVQTWLARSLGHLPRLSSSSESSGVFPTGTKGIRLDREEFGKSRIHGLLGAEKVDRFTTTSAVATGSGTSTTTPFHIAELLHAVDQEVRPLVTDLMPIIGDMI